MRAALWSDGEVEISGNGLSQIPFGKRFVAEFFFHDLSVSSPAFPRWIRIGSYSDADGGTPRTISDSHGGSDGSSTGLSASEVGDDVLGNGGKESLVLRANTQGEVLAAEVDGR